MNCKEECKNYEKKEDKNVFESGVYKISVMNGGRDIDIRDKQINRSWNFHDTLPLLEKAVDRARELRGE